MITGGIVTIDAMGCQKDIAESIIHQKADYVLSVKDNQKNLHESIRDCFNLLPKDAVVYRARDGVNQDHGRLEERSIEVMDASILYGLVDRGEWLGIASIAKIISKRESAYEKSEEHRYYISSLSTTNPERILRAIRSHWQIENTLHWSLDVTFKEDGCRVRDENTALNLSWMRKMALSFLKGETSFKASIRRKQLKLWGSPDYFLKVLGI